MGVRIISEKALEYALLVLVLGLHQKCLHHVWGAS
jgi:hypothetical protein